MEHVIKHYLFLRRNKVRRIKNYSIKNYKSISFGGG